MLFVCHPKSLHKHCFQFQLGPFLKLPREIEDKLMQNFGVTKKEHYGMLRYFLEWSIVTNVKVCMTGFPTRVPHGRISVSLLVIR